MQRGEVMIRTKRMKRNPKYSSKAIKVSDKDIHFSCWECMIYGYREDFDPTEPPELCCCPHVPNPCKKKQEKMKKKDTNVP